METYEALKHARIPSVLEDPQSEAIARVYANSLLDAAGDQQAEVIEELQTLVDQVLARQVDVQSYFASPMIDREQKLAMIDRVFGGGRAHPLIVNFLKVLARRDRLDLLRETVQQLVLLHERRTGKRRVVVTSAVPLSPDQTRLVGEKIASLVKFTPILDLQVDPAILGGLKVRVGDTVFDFSVRGRLNGLASRLRKRSVYEIQSGRNRFSS